MIPFILAAVAVQACVIAFFLIRLKKTALGKLGFLFMASTFLYHGLTEIVQLMFPGRDSYRSSVTPESLETWLALITTAMLLFSFAYMARIKRGSRHARRIPQLLRNLTGAYLLKWPVLLSMGLVGMVIIIAEKSGEPGYFTSGLADQFTGLMLAISLATASLTTARRWHLLMFVLFAVITASSGARGQVMIIILVALSAMVRYGFPISSRAIVAVGSLVLLAFIAISMSRGSYGRFQDEGILERLRIIGTSFESSTEGAKAVLEDSVYRSDGNSFGAMIVDRQLHGYGATGFPQLFATLAYCVPSFIYRSKLDLDDYLRNEEGYQDVFYDFPSEIDYISDIWSLLLGYTGLILFVVAAPVLGLLFAAIDNWLLRDVSSSAYLCGIGLSLIPTTIEMGIAGIPYTLRGLLVFLLANKLLSLRRHKRAGVAFPAHAT